VLRFDPTGTLVALLRAQDDFGDFDGRVSVWSVPDGELVGTVSPPDTPAFAFAAEPGSLVLGTSQGVEVVFYDAVEARRRSCRITDTSMSKDEWRVRTAGFPDVWPCD
jgi:hypothetical protein